jgi:hypothetical protein
MYDPYWVVSEHLGDLAGKIAGKQAQEKPATGNTTVVPILTRRPAHGP